jgi:hypothetical protein
MIHNTRRYIFTHEEVTKPCWNFYNLLIRKRTLDVVGDWTIQNKKYMKRLRKKAKPKVEPTIEV